MFHINDRIEKIRDHLQRQKIDAFLVCKPENIRYLSGFTGGFDARLFITAQRKYIISDSRYREQTARQCPEWELIEEKNFDGSKFNLLAGSFDNMAFESQVVSYDTYSWLKKNLKTELIPVKGIVENDRIIKDETELELIRQAAAIGDAVFAEMLSQIRLGMSEKEIADKIDNLLRQKGCEKEAFTTIAVAGENAALPHGTPGDKVIAAGEMITMDYGGFFQGYLADMTRTIGIGEMDSSYHDKYMAVLEAQQLGVSMIKAGIRCKDVDQAVRTRLQSYGLDEYFLHSTGHGVGLEVHEMPAVSSSSDTVVQPGMVITIEPGIYIKGWGGIRIEDTVIVKQDSCEVVTKANKNLILI